ncbi:glutathione S-transferase [Pseudorhodobacter ferrugineus]|uniref:glutathione S-transferase n=1 Tax=Pseudorhodobacter ferrugineus TaxID=77008 RepID=UPI0003B7A6B6|nr:glutathione S-transferase [Pseudorhodobacter ferrugineus]
MTYTLAIGDRGYSSWSLRGWLLFDAFDIPVKTQRAQMYTDAFPALLAEFVPARSVPALKLADGQVVPDTIAIAEELASRHPKAGHWPSDPSARAVARALVAEMHAGFVALRNHCTMNLRVSYSDCAPSAAVLADIARLETLLVWARATCDHSGPWLCGAYSAADVFYAPVAARIAGYNLPVSPALAEFVAAQLAHPSFRQWRAMGLVDGPDQAVYARDYPTRPWPGPVPMPARAVDSGPSVNTDCPYSGKPVTHFMEMSGRIWGFCNAFCRDKTVADPQAWPKFMALFNS